MKTYILKYPVRNSIDFPVGTIVKITDDYWGKGSNEPNTGFTVVQGKLKGQKGCVSNGLKTFLVENTKVNRGEIKGLLKEHRELDKSIERVLRKLRQMKPAILTP